MALRLGAHCLLVTIAAIVTIVIFAEILVIPVTAVAMLAGTALWAVAVVAHLRSAFVTMCGHRCPSARKRLTLSIHLPEFRVREEAPGGRLSEIWLGFGVGFYHGSSPPLVFTQCSVQLRASRERSVSWALWLSSHN
jgi:hypothetical protein